MHGIILGCGLLLAVPPSGDRGRDETSAADRRVASEYATQVLSTLSTIRQEYGREVAVVDLVRAAMEGLYEAVRQPVPRDLQTALKRSDAENTAYELLVNARARLGRDEALGDARDVLVSLQALSRVLDPYSGVVPESELRRVSSGFGLGFEISGASGSTNPVLPNLPNTDGTMELPAGAPFPWRTGKVIPGSPAQRVGLRPGDQITHVNTTAVSPTNAEKLFSVLREPPTSRQERSVMLTVRRVGREAPFDLRMDKESYTPESVFGLRREPDGTWDYWLDQDERIGYVRLGPIDEPSPSQIQEALSRLRGGRLRGLVFDLRWCPGGYLNPAVRIGEIFLSEGVIATARYDRGFDAREQPFMVGASGLPGDRWTTVPMVVLVNGATTGAGELIAAALQDHSRAVIVGQRTKGKASIQQVSGRIALPGYALKLTNGAFVRPNGKNLQRHPESKPADDWGVQPETRHRIKLSDEASDQLRDWWEQQVLRPGHAREALPMDDLRNDPQCRFSLGVIQRMLQGDQEELSEPK